MTRLIQQPRGLALLLLTVLCRLCCSSEAACYEKDSQALLAFKQELRDPNEALATWKAGTDCCNWNGVECGTAGRVESLRVWVNEPQRGGNLTVNPSVKRPGTSLGTLSALVSLEIINVNFSAPMPPGLGNLRNLRNLGFFGTSLVGQIPSSLGQLTKLTTLYIDGGSFSPSTIPSSICNLASLETLGIIGDLTSLPPCLATGLKKLQSLELNNNKLKGNIPVWLTSFPAITSIDLSGNQFTGNIPTAFGNMKKLQHLSLDDNQLQGRIPPELGNIASLINLGMSQNRLTGPIPPELGRLKNLYSLICGQNFITGPLPPELGTMPSLHTLHLFQNNITGGIPAAWANIGAGDQVEIRLSCNDLTGPLPPQLGKLRGGTLRLDHNKLTGGIPASYANLNWLAVDFNQLSDGHQIGPLVKPNSSLIFYLTASGNRFSGAIPTWLASFDTLTELDLSQNKFTGGIPAAVSGLKGLHAVRLAWNNLSGPIPQVPFWRDFPVSSFRPGNDGLCGAPLAPCAA